MRPSLIAVLVVALSAGLVGPASAALSITPGRVRMFTPPASAAAGSPTPVLAAAVGGTYRFEIGYAVAGAPRISTGHLFVIEDAVTGEQMQVLSRSFAPDGPGAYRESSTLTIPSRWAPGVYRLRWTLTARTPRLPSARATGARVFLVVP